MGSCLTKTKISRKSQSSRELRSKNRRRREKDAKRQETAEFSGIPDTCTSIATETVSEIKAESNEDCGATTICSYTRQITNTNESDEIESVLVVFYSRVEESEVNEPQHPNDQTPSQEPIQNDTEDGEENDVVHNIGVIDAEIDKNSSVCVVSEKQSVHAVDDVTKANEVGHSSLRSDFSTGKCSLRSHSKERETYVIDTEPTTLQELLGNNSNRICHNYTSTENNSNINDTLEENTNDTCIDLANNSNDIHKEDETPFSPRASTDVDKIDSLITKKPPSCSVGNMNKLRGVGEKNRMEGHYIEVASANGDTDLENYKEEIEDYITINLATTDFDENANEGLPKTTEKAINIKIADLLDIMFDESATKSKSKRMTNNACGRYALAESKTANTEVMARKRRSEHSLKIFTSKALSKAIHSLPKFKHRLSKSQAEKRVRNTTVSTHFEIKIPEGEQINAKVSESMPSYTSESISKQRMLYASDEMETKVINTLRKSLNKIYLHKSYSDCKVSVFVRSPYAECEPRKIQVRASPKQVKSGVAESFVKASTYVMKPLSQTWTDPPDQTVEKENQYTKKTSGLVLAEGNKALRCIQKPGISEVQRTNPLMYYENQSKGSELDRNTTFKGMKMDVVIKQFPGVLPVHVQKRLQKTQRKHQTVEIV